MKLTFIKPLVERVLRDPNAQWTVQGFGFLRAYFGPASNPKEFRLNLWDSRLSIANVSTIHDHPWHFDSLIVAGQFANQRYDMIADSGSEYALLPDNDRTKSCAYSTIMTGVDSNLEMTPTRHALLKPWQVETYQPGDTYHQDASEIHETLFTDGCVTLNKRTKVGDGEHARVFWPAGTDWVDAKPRTATPAEVAAITENALKGF